MQKISVAIVDDSSAIRDLVSHIINGSNDFELTHIFTNAEDAIQTLKNNPVSIVLMDIGLPKMDGIMCVRTLKKLCPDILFTMYTGSEDDSMIFEALQAGALGYLLKETDPNELIFALKELYNGGSPMSTFIARRIINTFQNSSHEKPSNPMPDSLFLTERENELLRLLHNGFRYKEIADKLSISIETVRRHCQNIYKKLQVQSKVEAINKVYQR